ncbi:MAG TPA: hypothetical protein VFA38_07530, partial [Nitrospirales bacterium]|nr:hypothetical protein [Nitrospirales bacterium]
GGFDETLSSCEDLDFFLRFTRGFTVHCHHQLVAEYRRHPGQMTRRPELIFRGFHETIRKQRDLIDANPIYREALAAGWDHMQRNWGEPVLWDLLEAVRQGGFRRTLRDLSILLQYYPGAILSHARRKLGRAATARGG